MDTNEKPRKLDVAESATIDIMSLNNKVVKMRPHVRKAKYQTVQKMIRTIQALKNKKGSEEQLEKNKRKVNRLLEDIQAVKILRPSRVSKFALANTLTIDEICKKPDTTPETRALARLSEHQALKTVVAKFREEHSDWKALADFLLGHISRRFFSNKYKTERIKMAANRRAGNQLMKSYIENKIGKDIHEKDNVDTKSKDEKQLTVKKENKKLNVKKEDKKFTVEKKYKESNVQKDDEKLTVKKEKKNKELTRKKVKAKDLQKNKHMCEVDIFSKHSDDLDDSDIDEDNINSNNESENIGENSEDEQDSDQNNSDSDCEKEDSDNLDSEDEMEGTENSDSEAEKQNVEGYAVNSNSDSEDEEQIVQNYSENSDSEIEKESSENYSDNNEEEESKNISKTKLSSEMVVKKFNVGDLLNSNDAEVPSFLINQSSEENVTHVKKSKDSFFMFGDDDEEEKSDVDNNNENDSDSDESIDDKISTDRNAMQSSFIGALNEAKPSHRNFDNNRGTGWGRGQSDKFRGGFQNFGKRGRGFQNFERGGRGFQKFERGGRGFQNFERRGRGNFQSKFRNAPQNAPREFQRSSGRGRGRGSFDSRQQQIGRPKQTKDYGVSSIGPKDSGKSSEKIHPSWEASKKRKEHLSIQAFQGKKIKFDED